MEFVADDFLVSVSEVVREPAREYASEMSDKGAAKAAARTLQDAWEQSKFCQHKLRDEMVVVLASDTTQTQMGLEC
ncbi:hypothetical protein [Sedimentitalea sp.]|uniref:hypothetical protein n=1 Tax=Sedimentitalea sp. TaxID=2048915 RepID=UPI003299CB4D